MLTCRLYLEFICEIFCHKLYFILYCYSFNKYLDYGKVRFDLKYLSYNQINLNILIQI